MKSIALTLLTVAASLLLTEPVLADAQKNDWLGVWQMTHDGHKGTLRITRLNVACTDREWCDMQVAYLDSSGKLFNASIERIDDQGQHMVFYINFPGNRQRFDAYLFSWDKLSLAGTTYWRGRTFGFAATKSKRAPERATGVVTRTILAGGIAEVRYADGTRKQISSGSTTTILPDGTRQSVIRMDTQVPDPPLLPSDSQALKRWREHHNESLLDIIKSMVSNDAGALNTLRTEEADKTLYQVISLRTRLIGRLLQQ
jgi:hypothetical protein